MSAPTASPTSSIARPAIRSRTFAALDNRDYRRFYLGQGVSLVGTWLQAAAVSWIVFDRTRSERISGLVEAAGVVPGALVGLFAGSVADRFNPRAVILVSQSAEMAMAFLLAFLVASGAAPVSLLALIVAATRVFVTFEMPARQVFLYEIVGKTSLMNAIALNSGLFNASRIFGPALAGVCLARLGETACFTLNGLSYLAAIGALLAIRPKRPERSNPPRARGDLLAGFRYLGADRRVGALFGLMIGFGLLGCGFAAVAPSYARSVIGTGPTGYSLLLASGGIGATLGAFGIASIGGFQRRDRLVVAGLIVHAVAEIATSTMPDAVGPLGGTARLVAGCLGMAGMGFGGLVAFAMIQTMIQTTVPDALRGRIMGIWMIAFSASVPVGCLWAGEAAEAIGVRSVLNLMGVFTVGLALVGAGSGWLVDRTASGPEPGPEPSPTL